MKMKQNNQNKKTSEFGFLGIIMHVHTWGMRTHVTSMCMYAQSMRTYTCLEIQFQKQQMKMKVQYVYKTL